MEIEDGKRVFRSEYITSRKFLFYNHKSCIFCKNCTDILLDFEGPYMLYCNKMIKEDNEDYYRDLCDITEWNKNQDCPHFIDDDEE